jgi:hypothetical protein
LVLIVGLAAHDAGWAQDPYGSISRRNAAREMLVLAVEQGIASLPPTNGQSFGYEYDAKLRTFSRSQWLGPVSFRTPETLGAGNASLRPSVSYFALSESFGPITYFGVSDDGETSGFTNFGLDVEADVGIFGLAATYGLTDRWDATLNVPVVLVNPKVSHSFLVDPSRPESVGGGGSREHLEELIARSGLVYVNRPFGGFQSTQVGLGRVSLGAVGKVISWERIDAAFSTEFFLASPNEDEFAGSDSYAVLPRGIVSLRPARGSSIYLDAGYAYDFSEDELRRFTWSVGAAIFFESSTLDFGLGGSKFDAPIHWTPTVTSVESPGSPSFTFVAQEENSLGTSLVDFRGGGKVFLADWLVVSGSVSLPLNDEGFRPDAVGALGAEIYF